MEKNEFRAMIKHLHMKSSTPKEIKAELDNVHSTSAPAYAIVYEYYHENILCNDIIVTQKKKNILRSLLALE